MKWYGRYGLVAVGLFAGVVSVLAAETLRPGGQGWRANAAPQPSDVSAMPTQHCGASATPAARLLCDSPELASLDLLAERLFASHLERLAEEGARRDAQQEQERWQRRVRDACSNAQCLRNAYRQRLGAFGFVID